MKKRIVPIAKDMLVSNLIQYGHPAYCRCGLCSTTREIILKFQENLEDAKRVVEQFWEGSILDLYGDLMLLTFFRNQEVTTLFISSTVVGTNLNVTVEEITSPYSNEQISLSLETMSGPFCSDTPLSNVDEKADGIHIDSISIPSSSSSSGANVDEIKADKSLEEFMAYIIDQPVVILKLNEFQPLFSTTPRLDLLTTGAKIPFYVSREDLSLNLGYIVVRVRR